MHVCVCVLVCVSALFVVKGANKNATKQANAT